MWWIFEGSVIDISSIYQSATRLHISTTLKIYQSESAIKHQDYFTVEFQELLQIFWGMYKHLNSWEFKTWSTWRIILIIHMLIKSLICIQWITYPQFPWSLLGTPGTIMPFCGLNMEKRKQLAFYNSCCYASRVINPLLTNNACSFKMPGYLYHLFIFVKRSWEEPGQYYF